ncbi:MAG: sulfite exporter TauE/SafE family protein [Thermodesulfobacteriota bacterium]
MHAFTPETYLLFIALGLGAGAFGTVIGAGGGFVLMPVLLLLFPQEPPERLTSISLAVVLVNALSGTEAYARMRRIDFRSGLIFAAATIPGAVLGAVWTGQVNRRFFDLVFGVLLVGLSAFLALKRDGPVQAHLQGRHHLGQVDRHFTEADGEKFDYSYNLGVALPASLVLGFMSSFLGIGGGGLYVSMLVYLLHFPVHAATATSLFVLSIMAAAGTLVHILGGAFHHGAHLMIPLAVGVLVGAQAGAYLARRLAGSFIIKVLAAALGLMGIKILATVAGMAG